MTLKLNTRFADSFVTSEDMSAIMPEVEAAFKKLHDGTGEGSFFRGWLDLPANYDKAEFEAIKKAAEKIRGDSDILIVIGIGGSYLGARAVIEFIKSSNFNKRRNGAPEIYFAGNSISSSSLAQIVELCEGKDFSVNVISKSGETTEPAVAFRVFRELLEKKYGKEGAKERIYATTDKARGKLKELSDRNGYQTFVVPDDVGGRYSVLTAVGLLPIAAAGIDIDALMQGADDARKQYADPDIANNDCCKYAAMRNVMYRKGKKIELMVSYEPAYALMGEWFKQLFGESEGKCGKGLFPASAIFSTDLHSLGQYVQQGERHLFETVVFINEPLADIEIKTDPENADGLNFLAGKTVSFINRKALEATAIAHEDGGVPSILIELSREDEYSLGWLLYFFEKACAVSGYVLGINPFDQPGVEDYKKNMYALLGKPGHEDRREAIERRLR
ncbi:MAG: glucose-6-phosphate isomerase [Clostridiales bacterium]|nr:glucose-6-phosphate isomerase [Clostridiales bacterium]